MGFTSVDRKYAAQTDDLDGENRRGADVYEVLADCTTETPYSARLAFGDDGNHVPRKGEMHPDDGLLFVDSARARMITHTQFEVDVEYTTSDQLSGEDNVDPLTTRADISVSYVVSHQAVDTDFDGNPIVNAAGDPFDPPVTTDIHERQIRVTQHVASFNLGMSDLYEDAVNEDEFMGWVAGSVKCDGFQAQRTIMVWGIRWLVSAVFTFRTPRDGAAPQEDVWKLRLLNQGFHKLVADSDGSYQPEVILDANDNPLTSPVWLSADGTETIPKPGPPNWLTFNMKRSMPFAAMNLRI